MNYNAATKNETTYYKLYLWNDMAVKQATEQEKGVNKVNVWVTLKGYEQLLCVGYHYCSSSDSDSGMSSSIRLRLERMK